MSIKTFLKGGLVGVARERKQSANAGDLKLHGTRTVELDGETLIVDGVRHAITPGLAVAIDAGAAPNIVKGNQLRAGKIYLSLVDEGFAYSVEFRSQMEVQVRDFMAQLQMTVRNVAAPAAP